MPRISPLVAAPPLIFAALAGMLYFGMYREDPNALPSVFVGRSAPPVASVPLLDYPTFADADLATGGAKIVNFWASWCAPCRVEHPKLIGLSKTYPVYGVNRDDTPEAAAGFLNDLGNPFDAIVFDADKETSFEWGVYGLPETFVIDGTGKVILRYPGAITSDVFEQTIRPALEEAGGAAPPS